MKKGVTSEAYTKCRYGKNQVLRFKNENHQNIDPDESVFEYVCVCGRTFTASRSLERHKTFCCTLRKTFECVKCHVKFNQRHDLTEHMKTVHCSDKRQNVICAHCYKPFSTRSTLIKHIRSIHSNQNINNCTERRQCLTCAHCGTQFHVHSNLIRHMKASHPTKNLKIFTEQRRNSRCDYCCKQFSNHITLVQHVKNIHLNQNIKNSIKRRRRSLICALCGKQFSLRCNLIRHIKVIHPSQNFRNANYFSNTGEYFECAECHLKVRRKDALVEHIKEQHQIIGLDKSVFECNYCGRKCKRKFDVLRHIHSLHSYSLKRWSNSTDFAKCTVCGLRFPLKVELIKHYEIDHHIQLVHEDLIFQSANNFEKWKTDLHHQLICQFVKRSFWRSATEEITRYGCHRSGSQKIKDTCIRKRFLKIVGSKRLGGYCPAEIVARRKLVDNSYVVRYQKIHVGHDIGTEDEMKHMFFKEEEKSNCIRNMLTSQQRTLRLRHRTAQKQFSETESITIQPSSSETWFVSSFKDTAKTKLEMCLVSKQDSMECTSNGNKPCHLMCTLCGICFHQYKCSCRDWCIRNNMCKHIHSLGIYFLQAIKDMHIVTDDIGTEANCSSNLISGNVVHNNEEMKSTEEIEKLKLETMNFLESALQMVTTIEDLREIQTRYIKPIVSMLTRRAVVNDKSC